MNLQIETVTTPSGKMDVIRDIEKVKQMITITKKAMQSIREYPCGHKPYAESGPCEACQALKEWDALSSNDPSSGAA